MKSSDHVPCIAFRYGDILPCESGEWTAHRVHSITLSWLTYVFVQSTESHASLAVNAKQRESTITLSASRGYVIPRPYADQHWSAETVDFRNYTWGCYRLPWAQVQGYDKYGFSIHLLRRALDHHDRQICFDYCSNNFILSAKVSRKQLL